MWRFTKMTNFEYLQQLSLEEYAKERLDKVPTGHCIDWSGDFPGFCDTYEEALEKEIEWLNQSHIEYTRLKGGDNIGDEEENKEARDN